MICTGCAAAGMLQGRRAWSARDRGRVIPGFAAVLKQRGGGTLHSAAVH